MAETFFLYFSILLFSTGFAYAHEKACREQNKELAAIFSLLLFLVAFIPAAIRYRVGTDYWSYIEIFEIIAKDGETHVEIGYEYINRLIAILGLDAQWLVVCVSFITYSIFYKALPVKKGWYINIIFITSYYLYTYSNFRTGIVFSLMFYALINYIKSKKLLTFLFFVLISSLMHKSAIFYIIVPVLLSERVEKFFACRWNISIAMVLSILFFLLADQIIKFIVNVGVVNVFGYSGYVNSELYFSDPQLGSGLGVLARALPLILFIMLGFSEVHKNKAMAKGSALAFFFIFLISLSSTIEILSRLENLFFPVYMLVCYIFITNSSRVKASTFISITTFIFIILFIKDIEGSQSDLCKGMRISPYVSILNKEDDKSLTVDRNICES